MVHHTFFRFSAGEFTVAKISKLNLSMFSELLTVQTARIDPKFVLQVYLYASYQVRHNRT